MKKNNVFTEEGQTQLRNTLRQVRFFFLLMLPVTLASAYGIHRFWVKPNFTPLQHVYFRQYLRSSVKSYLPRSRSPYTYMSIVVTDPRTNRDVRIAVKDEHVNPDLNEEGDIKIDRGYPVFRPKPDVKVKEAAWKQELIPDKNAYAWFRAAIFEDQSIIEIWRWAWLGPILILVAGMIALTTLYKFAQGRYVKGEQVRGTRELSPREYRKEHRKHTGYAVKVYSQVMNHDCPAARLFRFQSALIQVDRTS